SRPPGSLLCPASRSGTDASLPDGLGHVQARLGAIGAGAVDGRAGARKRCGPCWRKRRRPGPIHAASACRRNPGATVPRGWPAESRRWKPGAGRRPHALLLFARALTAGARLGRRARALRGSDRSANRTTRAGLSAHHPRPAHPGAAGSGERELEPHRWRHWGRLKCLEPPAAVSPTLPLLPLPDPCQGPIPVLELRASRRRSPRDVWVQRGNDRRARSRPTSECWLIRRRRKAGSEPLLRGKHLRFLSAEFLEVCGLRIV